MATGIVKRYDDGPPVTLGDPAYITQSILDRAEEIAEREGWRGPGKFSMGHLRKARGQFGDGERAAERGLHCVHEPTQAQRAAEHQDQLAAMYVKQGKAKTLGEARRMANEAAPEIARRAGAADLGRSPEVKTHAGPGPRTPTHREAQTVSREVLVRQIAAAAMGLGLRQPGAEGRAAADFWAGVNFPPPRPGVARAEMEAYNRMRERLVNEIVEDARRLLADPAARAKLRP